MEQVDNYLIAQKIIGEAMEKIIESGIPSHAMFDINSVLAQVKIQVIPETFNKKLNPNGGIQIKMASLKEASKNHETKKTKNIAELASVPIDLELYTESGKDMNGKSYSFDYIELSGMKYRVPDSVKEQIKAILMSKPNCKNVKVNATGTGMNTKYNTIPLD